MAGGSVEYFAFMADKCDGRPFRQPGPAGKSGNESWYHPTNADRKWAAISDRD